MDKFLEIHNFPRLNNEIDNLNRSITSKETKSVIRNLPTKKVLDQMTSLMNSANI